MIFVMMMFDERKKNKNRKKTQEEREEISLSLSPCFIFYHPPPSRRCELFGFVCSKHSIKVYSYHLHDDAEKRIISKRKKKQK